MKLIVLISLFILSTAFCQTKPGRMQLGELGTEYKWMIWHSYVIDSTYWRVWLPNGDLPRRANGTYLYWKEDKNGKLIPLRKIEKRLPIFMDQLPSKREKSFFE